MSKTIIIPTVGRVVWYYPPSNVVAEPGFARNSTPGEPHAAIVARVWNPDCVNLTVFDANGTAHGRTSVKLIHDDDAVTESMHCRWMPYQKGQAAKQEALQPPTHWQTHRQHLELAVAGSMPGFAVEGGDGAEVGKQVRQALDALLGESKADDTAKESTADKAGVTWGGLSLPELAKQLEAEASRPNRSTITRSRICGVDCKPGAEHCNNYCGRDGSKPMANAPARYEVRDEFAAHMKAMDTNLRPENAVAPAYLAYQAAVQGDLDYQWVVHCNIAMPIMDELGVSHEQANKTAARLLSHLFGVNMEANPTYKQIMALAKPDVVPVK